MVLGDRTAEEVDRRLRRLGLLGYVAALLLLCW